MFGQDSRVTFAFRLDPAASLTGKEVVEIGTTTGDAVAKITAGQGYDLQDATTGIVAVVPREALGPAVHGALRFRMLRDGEPSRWTPLGTAVRLPDLQAATCTTVCTLKGNRLFLIRSIAGNDRFDAAQNVPDGYTAASVDLPAPDPATRTLFLRLRDAPDAIGVVTLPAKSG